MKKQNRWKRGAAAVTAGILILQAAGCGNTSGTAGNTSWVEAEDPSGSLAEENTAGSPGSDSSAGSGNSAGSDNPSDSGNSSEQRPGRPGGGRETANVEEPEGSGLTAEYEEADLDDSWQEEGSTVISCTGTNAKIEGSGAYQKDGVIQITKAGTYILRGDYQGQICVDAGKEDQVQLVLDEFSITCENSSSIYGLQSGKIILTLADGTENQVSDSSNYVFSSADEDEPDAAVFSKDDLTINGTGKLTVQGNYSNGIRSKDDLKIISGELSVTAVKDGIKGKDSVSVRNGQIQVESGEDGIKSNNDSDAEKGYVIIDGGTIEIHAGDDGIHAETWLTIHDGTINIAESYEGLEGMKVDINGGTITVKASDDGINGAASGSTEEDSNGEPGGERAKMEADPDVYVRITGGQIQVDSGADGIDSNGNLFVHGGITYISGPVDGANGALDYNGGAIISGGVFGAAGSAGMMQTFSESSQQRMLMVYYDQSQEGGTEVSLKPEQGEAVFSWSPEKRFECILISVPELADGETYELTTGSESQKITVDGILTQAGERSGRAGGRGGFGRPEGSVGSGEKGGPGRKERPE